MDFQQDIQLSITPTQSQQGGSSNVHNKQVVDLDKNKGETISEDIGGGDNDWPDRQANNKSSRKNAYMNLVKGYIGSGILALPYAFNQAGWILSTIIFLLVALVVYETMNLLFELADSYDKDGIDYSFMAQDQLGTRGVILVKTFLVIFSIGCCISYVIFFIKFLENVFSMMGSKQNDLVYLMVALVVIIPMSFINDISKFARFSTAANIMIIATLLVIFGYNAQRVHDLPDEKYRDNIENFADFSRIPMLVGVSIYAFEAISLMFSIRNSIENPKENFHSIFRNVNIVMVVLYISFSVTGVIAHGDDMKEILLFNLPNDKIDVKFFQILYAFALIMSYPLQLLPSFHIIEDIPIVKNFIQRVKLSLSEPTPEKIMKNKCFDINQKIQHEEDELRQGQQGQESKNERSSQTKSERNTQSTLKEKQPDEFIYNKDSAFQQLITSTKRKAQQCKNSADGKRAFVRICITLLICFSAYAIPRFAVFLNIIGAVAGTSLQFVFPIIMYIKTFEETITKIRKYVLICYLIIGLIGGITSFIFSIISLFESRD